MKMVASVLVLVFVFVFVPVFVYDSVVGSYGCVLEFVFWGGIVQARD
jgi:hypothetical protein